MAKYILTEETKTFLGHVLHRIKATVSFGTIVNGELGGWIEKEENLSQDGNAWVYGNAKVSGNAWVSGDAEVSGDAWVYGNAWVSGDAEVSGDAWVYGDADYFLVGRIGSRFGFTTFFKTKDGGISVSCGCFLGSIAEFREKVKQTHGNNKHAKVYNLAADMAEMQIGDDKDV